MRTQSVTLGLTLLLITGAVVAAEAKPLHLYCKGGGAFTDGVETNIDTNGDGVSAIADQAVEICNTGKFLFQEEQEWSHQKTVTASCPAGTTDEYHIDSTQGQGRFVSTAEKTGDQLFYKRSSGILCINFSSSPFSLFGSAHDENIGGTGKYAGATGALDGRFAGIYLQSGCKGGCPLTGPDASHPFGGFGQYTFTSDGTLTLPKSEENGNEGD